MDIPRQRRPATQIDMTPMIDCVFQLLIFFMLSSSFQSPSIQLALPEAATQDQTQTPEITVTVDEQGNFYVNSERVPAEELETRLKPLVAQSKHKVVTFRGDGKMQYQWFVKALDAARKSGAANLDVAHQGTP